MLNQAHAGDLDRMHKVVLEVKDRAELENVAAKLVSLNCRSRVKGSCDCADEGQCQLSPVGGTAGKLPDLPGDKAVLEAGCACCAQTVRYFPLGL